jgi:hypothetical protein
MVQGGSGSGRLRTRKKSTVSYRALFSCRPAALPPLSGRFLTGLYQGRDTTQALMPPIPIESLPAGPGGAGTL